MKVDRSKQSKKRQKMERIKDFRNHLQHLGYSQSSLQMLPACAAEFISFTRKPIDRITPEDIKNYHRYLKERPNKRRPGGLSESYIHHHIYSLKLFFAYQMEKNTITTNPISGMNFKSPTGKPREILTLREIKQLYTETENAKERAVLSLFYGCGLRRTEGEKLNLKDIRFRSGLLYVRHGKGKKRRVIPMSEKVARDLQDYALKEREQTGIYQPAFILNEIGTRMSGDSHNKLVKKLVKRACIDKIITLHSLRHSIATHLLESGLPLEYVRDFLGHKYLESTQIYTRINQRQLWNLNNT